MQWILVFFFSHYRRLFHLLMGGSYGAGDLPQKLWEFHGSTDYQFLVSSDCCGNVTTNNKSAMVYYWVYLSCNQLIPTIQVWLIQNESPNMERKWCPLPLGSDGFRSLPPSLGIWQFQKGWVSTGFLAWLQSSQPPTVSQNWGTACHHFFPNFLAINNLTLGPSFQKPPLFNCCLDPIMSYQISLYLVQCHIPFINMIAPWINRLSDISHS